VPAATRTTHLTLALLALATGGFAIGTTEFVTMGLLPDIADGIHQSIPTTGHIITAYALGVVVGAPVIVSLAARLPKRALVIGLVLALGIGNAVTATATGYWPVMAARFVAGLPHGAYFGVASLVAANLVTPERRGRAIAGVMMGLSVANVVGVPAATWLGQHAGWRATYLACSVLALVTVGLVLLSVPHQPVDRTATGRAEAGAFFRNSQVWLTMLAGAVGFGGLFAVYSYIAETVQVVGGLGEGAVPFFTLAFGLGMVAGTWLGGELSHWSVFRALISGSLASAAILVVFWFAAPAGWWLWPVAFGVTALGSVVVINLQLRLMDVAGDAVTLGAAMNHAALNVANALGAFVGGIVIDAGYSYRAPALVGAALSVLGVAILLYSATLHRRNGTATTASAQ